MKRSGTEIVYHRWLEVNEVPLSQQFHYQSQTTGSRQTPFIVYSFTATFLI